MVVLYGVADEVTHARQWLEDHKISFEWHDYRLDGAPLKAAARWLQRYSFLDLINQHCMSWYDMTPELKADCARYPLSLFDVIPTVLRKPILDYGDDIVIGFSEAEYRRVLL